MCHVLEHLGATADVYFAVIRELYRVCKHGDHRDHRPAPAARRLPGRSRLGIKLGVDLEIVHTQLAIDELWAKLAPHEVADAMRRYNNVVKEIRITLRVEKP